MVLDKLDDGASRLLLVLCLPLIDGVFATLLVSGAIDGPANIVSIALTVFSGAGALAVLFSHAENSSEARNLVLQASPFLLVGAVAVALVAPVFENIFNPSMMRTAAGIALLSISLQMAGVDLAQKISVPGVLLTGMALGFKGIGPVTLSAEYVLPAGLTALTACLTLFLAARFAGREFNLQYIRYGGALVLVAISLSLFGLPVPAEASLGVLGISLLASQRSHDLKLESLTPG